MATVIEPLERGDIITRIGRPKKINLRNIIRWFMPWRKETDTERINRIAEERERHRRKAINDQIRMEAEQYAIILSKKLADLNLCTRRTVDGHEVIKRKIKWEEITWDEDCIYFKVNFKPGKSPYGVTVDMLKDEGVINTLSASIERPVFPLHLNNDQGFYYGIERIPGRRGIPSHVPFLDMLERRSPNIPRLSVPIGVNEKRDYIWLNLADAPHVLVGGTTGAGKSNFINTWICSLLGYCKTSQIKFVLIDLKGGLEFGFFEKLTKHLLQIPKPKPFKKKKKSDDDLDQEELIELDSETLAKQLGISFEEDGQTIPALVESRVLVPHVLYHLVRIGEQRMVKLRNSHCKNVGEYNFKMSHKGAYIEPIVCIFDEIGDLQANAELQKKTEIILANLLQRMRAVGIHIVICTQRPSVDVVSGLLKALMPVRVAFNCGDPQSSRTIITDGSAAGLSTVGRCIYEKNGFLQEVQSAFITSKMVDYRVEQAALGLLITSDEVANAGTDVTPDQLFAWALVHTNGELVVDTLFAHFKDRKLTRDDIDAILKRYEGKDMMLSGSMYRLMPRSVHRPRALIATDNLDDQTPHAPVDVDETPAPFEIPSAPEPEPEPTPEESAPVEPPSPPQITATAIPDPAIVPVLEWSLENKNGDLPVEFLIKEFKGRIGQTVIRKCLSDLDSQVIELNGNLYQVTPPVVGNFKTQRPRHLQPVTVHIPDSTQPTPFERETGTTDDLTTLTEAENLTTEADEPFFTATTTTTPPPQDDEP